MGERGMEGGREGEREALGCTVDPVISKAL